MHTNNYWVYFFSLNAGAGVNIILDCIGSSFVDENLVSVAIDGRWILYGLLGGANVEGGFLGALLRKRVSLIATTLRSRSLEVSECDIYMYLI